MMDNELKQYLDAKFTKMEERLASKEDLERVETKLLASSDVVRRRDLQPVGSPVH